MMNENDSRPLAGWRIGFIGLGLMGKPMCLNLLNAGAEICVFNRSATAIDEIKTTKVTVMADPAAVAAEVDLVILMLADTPAVEQVLFTERGVAQGVHANSLIVDMGTTATLATRDFASRLAEKGARYIDAPVSGGQIGAKEATLSIMAGGDAVDIDAVMPVFEAMGRLVTHVGPVSSGQVTKAVNQVIVGLTIGAVSEALAVAKRAGVDLEKAQQALMGGHASSRILQEHGTRMINQTFEPGGKVVTQAKDMQQALDLAAELGIELPATALNLTLYKHLIENGLGALDHSALYTYYDQ
jgi:3-hydroxyisobutyrate dehydrogenase-like beta-hydroxyacid dehydrogenase